MNFGIPNRNARIVFVGFFLLLLIAGIVRLASDTPTQTESNTAPTARPLFVNTTCADVVVFGLRGSGQSSTKNAGVGEEVFKSVKNMVTRLHTTSDETVRLEAVNYQAAKAATFEKYLAGVDDGQRRLGSQYEKLSQDCPDSKVAIIGFSQGAQAVHEFAGNLPAGQTRNLVLVGMIADPRKNPADTITEWSYTSKQTTEPGKLSAGPKFGPGTRHTAITLCVEADEVCNWPGAGGSTALSETHKHFYEKARTVRSTGERLNAVLHLNGVG